MVRVGLALEHELIGSRLQPVDGGLGEEGVTFGRATGPVRVWR